MNKYNPGDKLSNGVDTLEVQGYVGEVMLHIDQYGYAGLAKEEKLEESGFKPISSGRWKPSLGQLYWFVDSGRIKETHIWYNDGFDNYRHKTGNCHKTEADLDEYIRKLEAWAGTLES